MIRQKLVECDMCGALVDQDLCKLGEIYICYECYREEVEDEGEDTCTHTN